MILFLTLDSNLFSSLTDELTGSAILEDRDTRLALSVQRIRHAFNFLTLASFLSVIVSFLSDFYLTEFPQKLLFSYIPRATWIKIVIAINGGFSYSLNVFWGGFTVLIVLTHIVSTSNLINAIR